MNEWGDTFSYHKKEYTKVIENVSTMENMSTVYLTLTS